MKNKCKEFRKRHNLTQEDAAKTLGVTRKTIHNAENSDHETRIGKLIDRAEVGLAVEGIKEHADKILDWLKNQK